MIRTKSAPIIFLFIIFTFLLAACTGLAGIDSQVEPVLQETTGQSSVSVDQSNPDPAQLNGQSAAQAPAQPSASLGQLFAHEEAFIDLFERVNNSVVHIGVDDGQGSGFVYDDSGYIVTNNHVVALATAIVITFTDGEQLDAEVVGTDPGSDLAVLKVER